MMWADSRSHLTAVLQALLVTFLWSTSFVLIKWGLEGVPALTFAGLRYGLAALLLAPWVLVNPGTRDILLGLSRADLVRLGMLGIVFYAVTQGAQFLGLSLLPAVVVTLMLCFSPILVATAGGVLLGEKPTLKQWLGLGVFLAGVLVYFLPVTEQLNALGLAVMAVGVLANAWGSILGRQVNRSGRLPPVVITVVSMSVGATLLLVTGVASTGFPALEFRSWLLVGWLAVVNTALAFTLWNHTLRRLTAMESSIINNTMLIQIALLAWVFLDEPLGARKGLGIVLAALGAALVQLGTRHSKPPSNARHVVRKHSAV